MDVLDLARDIIIYSNLQKQRISNLKLQKMLYYIQGYCLKNHHQAAFQEPILHWDYGPVVPDAYYEYSIYGAEPIKGDFSADDKILFKEFDRKMAETIRRVIDACGTRTASKLVEQTHHEKPWMDTKRNQQIGLQCIENYFVRHDPLNLELDSKAV